MSYSCIWGSDTPGSNPGASHSPLAHFSMSPKPPCPCLQNRDMKSIWTFCQAEVIKSDDAGRQGSQHNAARSRGSVSGQPSITRIRKALQPRKARGRGGGRRASRSQTERETEGERSSGFWTGVGSDDLWLHNEGNGKPLEHF